MMMFMNTTPFRHMRLALIFVSVITILSVLMGCNGPSIDDLQQVDFTPLIRDDWEVSTPGKQGLDPLLVAKMYYRASELETIYSLLVIKDGYLIAEDYFNEGFIDQKDRLQSVTKSFTSALVGIALEQGYISSLDQKLLDFFPEIKDLVTDKRKEQITIRDMLQMRAGYPSEDPDPSFWAGLLSGHYPPLIEEFPLVANPRTQFNYSNLTSNWLGIIVDRMVGTNLRSYAEEHLFSKIGIDAGEWGQDAEGHNNGCADLHLSARDAAKFGLLYLHDGQYEGKQVIPVDWVHDSLQQYSENINMTGGFPANYGLSFGNIGYGYHWWSARAGDHDFDFAQGHGGQLIVIINEFNMVIVVTAYPFHLKHNSESWKHEKANLNLVGEFIKSLPGG